MNNLSSTFTIDDLREIAYRGSYRDSERALARELLALRRAQREPIAFIAECGAIIGEGSPFFDDYKNPQPLYAAPQLPAVPEGWVIVPREPTEGMIVDGFESEPDEDFSEPEVWKAYQAMSGCQQAAYRAKLCWAAMIAAAPKPE